MIEPRRHIVGGGPNPKTGKNIVVIEDTTLPADHGRVECAYSDLEFGNMLALIAPTVAVKPVKGHPRHVIHFFVSSANFDEVVGDFENPEVKPMTDLELAREIMRATKGNN